MNGLRMILATTMYALALNDIYNGAPGRQYASHSIPILAVVIPFVFVLGVNLYERYIDVKKNDAISSASTTDMDMDIEFASMSDINSVPVVNPINNTNNESVGC